MQPFFALIVGLLMTPAAEAVTSQSFKVSATIVPGCAVATGSGGVLGTLDFGTHNGVESAPVSTSFVPNGALSIACTPGVALSMSINGGQNYSTVRRMKRSNAPTWWDTGFTAAARWPRTAKLASTRRYR